MSQKSQSQKFLIIQTAFIGDVVLSLPVAQILKSKFPDCSVSFFVRKGNENLLENHPAVDDIFIWNKRQGKYRSLYANYSRLKKIHWDGIFNLHRFFSTGLLTSVLHGDIKVGFDKNPFSKFFDHAIAHEIPFKEDGNVKHEVDRNLQLLSPLNIQEFENPKLYPSQQDYDAVKSYKNNPYYVIAPSSVWFTKQWPQSKWIELIQNVPETIDILLIGGPGDTEYCDEIAEHKSNCINAAGKLTFLQSAALIDDALLTIVNDSAPLHFSSAMNTPTIAIYCSTIPDFGFYPLAENSQVVEYSGELYCRPCGLHGFKECPEDHFQCAQDIPIKSVLEAIHNVIEPETPGS
ncbi:MAG: glycosyltransferase family 9 protein [Candidatus Marinimicrobia bacterium]|nr:glycosyltransferase family 9 protein [Candidatus Neomarinimicrobiota bacterium]